MLCCCWALCPVWRSNNGPTVLKIQISQLGKCLSQWTAGPKSTQLSSCCPDVKLRGLYKKNNFTIRGGGAPSRQHSEHIGKDMKKNQQTTVKSSYKPLFSQLKLLILVDLCSIDQKMEHLSCIIPSFTCSSIETVNKSKR